DGGMAAAATVLVRMPLMLIAAHGEPPRRVADDLCRCEIVASPAAELSVQQELDHEWAAPRDSEHRRERACAHPEHARAPRRAAELRERAAEQAREQDHPDRGADAEEQDERDARGHAVETR